MKNKNIEEMDEVNDEIEAALKDPKGVVSHQKRLAFCLSLGISELLEKYLIKKNVLKKGYKINHQWLKKKRDNVKSLLKDKIIGFLENLDKLDRILEIAYKIENKRNELAYGGRVADEVLRELINDFLDIKKEVESD